MRFIKIYLYHESYASVHNAMQTRNTIYVNILNFSARTRMQLDKCIKQYLEKISMHHTVGNISSLENIAEYFNCYIHVYTPIAYLSGDLIKVLVPRLAEREDTTDITRMHFHALFSQRRKTLIYIV